MPSPFSENMFDTLKKGLASARDGTIFTVGVRFRPEQKGDYPEQQSPSVVYRVQMDAHPDKDLPELVCKFSEEMFSKRSRSNKDDGCLMRPAAYTPLVEGRTTDVLPDHELPELVCKFSEEMFSKKSRSIKEEGSAVRPPLVEGKEQGKKKGSAEKYLDLTGNDRDLNVEQLRKQLKGVLPGKAKKKEEKHYLVGEVAVDPL